MIYQLMACLVMSRFLTATRGRRRLLLSTAAESLPEFAGGDGLGELQLAVLVVGAEMHLVSYLFDFQ
ncbi:hypothetical protein BBK14_24335 [Parafrankia soli]|uniref:Uncharacterized protein n=1 Tax=Parafrankia soli TaxID=2599596 RepID=A0A1S1PK46_9ACTN|nr:hypothetical protein BBK14_24335 [Parafrankia soli]